MIGELADVLAKLKGVRPCANGYVARCPAHDDRNPSLSIREGADGRTLLYCFVGCDYASIADALGLRRARPAEREKLSRPRSTDSEHEGRKLAAAARIWHEATPAGGTLTERYIRERGIGIAIPDTLRFHPMCPHPSGAKLPAVVAAVARVGMEFRGIHRIFLRADGLGKAGIEPSKASLGPVGGAMVPLTEFTETLAIGEGIETTLSVMAALSGDSSFEACSFAAALSTSGMRALEIPDVVRELIILADHDEPGERAAQALAQKALREGRRVRIAIPGREGADFNDELLRI